ncbi:related to HNM1-choline permease [Sporisorium reilianum SRZ2]|uniref:Related to HNM1-choline permease n=1 Tax=Sporisorium reilianum (strain SRZ2) TaxID=999809 RepID=E7A3C0_SPORE|nr:related to HNM1-choline permease [Sporisorium reilianum SRZ2]
MEAKGKDMSSKEAYSTAQVTVSELDRQAPVTYVGDGSEDQAHHHVDGEPMLGRKLSSLGATALGYTTLATWVAYSASSATALASGGANVLVWGLIIVAFCNAAGAITIAEPASQFPSASGQAAWVYRLHGRLLSYITSWVVLLGYVFLSVAGEVMTSTILLAMINLTFPSYVIEKWHVSLCMIATATFVFLVSTLGGQFVSRLNVFAFLWSTAGLLAIVLTLLIQTRGDYNTVEFALVDITNLSGWGNNFVPWVLGLSQAALATTAMDAACHFSEEMANASRQVPIAIFGSFGTSVGTTLAYAFVLVFTLPSIDEMISTSTGFPFAEMLRIKTSREGAIVLLLVPLVSMLITVSDVVMATSRCIYGFSRQSGFPFSSYFGKVNARLDSPVRAGVLSLVAQCLISLIYIGNTAAFNALISVPTLLLAVSYSIVAYVCLVARWKAGQNERGASSTEKASQSQDGRTSEGSESDSVWDPPFKMGAWLTVSSNVVTIVFTVLLCVFLSPPPSPPLSPCSSAQPNSPPWLARFLWPSATFPANARLASGSGFCLCALPVPWPLRLYTANITNIRHVCTPHSSLLHRA